LRKTELRTLGADAAPEDGNEPPVTVLAEGPGDVKLARLNMLKNEVDEDDVTPFSGDCGAGPTLVDREGDDGCR
jgi:hypothetical protein